MARKIKFDFILSDFIPEWAQKSRKLSATEKSSVRRQVADFIREKSLSKITSGKSPVAGEGSFPRLNKEYANLKKGGNTTRNLTLTSNMLGSYDVVDLGRTLRVTVSNQEQPKARGHNQFQGDKKPPNGMPKARFIPDEREKQFFSRDITSGVKKIIRENIE